MRNNSCYQVPLVAWWVTIQLPMQGTWVPSLLREDPTQAANAEPAGPEPCPATRHAIKTRRPGTSEKRKAALSSAQRGETPGPQEDPALSSFAQACPALCGPRDCSPQAPLPERFSRREHCSGWPCPPPGHLPHPGMEPRFPALQQILDHLSHQGSPAQPKLINN